MFVSHKKQPNSYNTDQIYNFQRSSNNKLKIISGQATRTNSESKINLNQSNISNEELNQLSRISSSSMNHKNNSNYPNKNRKMLSLSSKYQKQYKNVSLNKHKQQLERCAKNNQIQSKPLLFNCQEICRMSQLTDKVVLQSSVKRNIRCAVSLSNSQIQNDKIMFQNSQFYETPKNTQNPQIYRTNYKKQVYLSPIKQGQKTQASSISYNQIKKRQNNTIKWHQGELFNYEKLKSNFNIAREEPSFQIFQHDQNNSFNLTDICRPSFCQSDGLQPQSGRSTIIDLLKDLQSSEEIPINNKNTSIHSKISHNTKVNFFY